MLKVHGTGAAVGLAAAIVMTGLFTTTPASARRIYDNVTISEGQLRNRCRGQGGRFIKFSDGRVACRLPDGTVLVCQLAIDVCHSNQVRTTNVVRSLLGGGSFFPFGSRDPRPRSPIHGDPPRGGGFGDGPVRPFSDAGQPRRGEWTVHGPIRGGPIKGPQSGCSSGRKC